MSEWLAAVERAWNSARKAKAAKFDVYEWLDWGGKLTAQSCDASWAVAYNVSGTYLAAASVDLREKPRVVIDGNEIRLNGLIMDYTIIFRECTTKEESLYLAGILNSEVIREVVEPMQAKGLWGARHFVKKPLEVGIPKFVPDNKVHRELASLAQTSAATAQKVLDAFVEKKGGKVDNLSPQVVGQLRSKIRAALAAELDRIDALVCEILAA